MFDSNRTLKLILVTLSLWIKVLGFQKEREFKVEEDNDDNVNKVVLTIAIEQNI